MKVRYFKCQPSDHFHAVHFSTAVILYIYIYTYLSVCIYVYIFICFCKLSFVFCKQRATRDASVKVEVSFGLITACGASEVPESSFEAQQKGF